MQFLIILSIATSAVLAANIPAEQRQRANEHVAACVKEVGVAPETARKLSQGDFSSHDEKAQCFAKCFMEKAGFIDSHGQWHDDVIVAKLSHHDGEKADAGQLKALVSKCKSEAGATPCEKVFKASKCFYEHKKKAEEAHKQHDKHHDTKVAPIAAEAAKKTEMVHEHNTKAHEHDTKAPVAASEAPKKAAEGHESHKSVKKE